MPQQKGPLWAIKLILPLVENDFIAPKHQPEGFTSALLEAAA